MLITKVADQNINSLADIVRYGSGGYSGDMRLFAAQTIIEMLSNLENGQFVSTPEKAYALGNITKTIAADPVLFDAAFMLVTMVRTDAFLSGTDTGEKKWSSYRAKALADATEGLAKYENFLLRAAPNDSGLGLVECLQRDVFDIAGKLFQGTASSSPRDDFGLTQEGHLLKYVVDKIPKPYVMAGMKDILVQVAAVEPNLVHSFLERQIYERQDEYPFTRYSNNEVCGAARRELECFVNFTSMQRVIKAVTLGKVGADPDPGSIAALSDLKRHSRKPLSILAT